MLENRSFSFFVMILIYICVGFCGIFVFKFLEYEWWISLLVADVVATILTFVFSLIFKNASVYDPYWSVQPLVIIYCFAIKYGINIYGIFLLICISYWGIRLTCNWAYTFKNLRSQDWRYTMLCEQTRKFYPIINFIGIHMVPTLVVYCVTVPAVFAIVEKIEFNLWSSLVLLLCIIAASIQLVADIQMQKFRNHRTSTFIRSGLWKHGRHPNYFGEILMWWGIGISCVIAMPEKWYLIFGAIINTMLFSFVSIPMAEKRQSKKEGFEEYKKETRILI